MALLVFIDTSVIRSEQFGFKGTKLNQIAHLAKHGTIRLVSTDITVREVKSQIAEAVTEAAAAIRKAASKSLPVKNVQDSPFQVLFQDFDPESHTQSLITQCDEFFASPNALVLPATGLAGSKIFEKYFAGAAPFGQGKKKSEFPDAFVLEALEQVAMKESAKIMVVSLDSDFANACASSEHLQHFPSLASAIENILSLTDDARVALAHATFVRHEARVSDALQQRLLDEAPFLIADHDGDIEDISIKDVDLSDIAVIEVSENGAGFDVLARCEIDFDVTYPDPDSYYYDSEDGIGTYFETVVTTLERTVEFPIEVKAVFDSAGEVFAVESIELNGNQPLKIWVDPDAETGWK